MEPNKFPGITFSDGIWTREEQKLALIRELARIYLLDTKEMMKEAQQPNDDPDERECNDPDNNESVAWMLTEWEEVLEDLSKEVLEQALDLIGYQYAWNSKTGKLLKKGETPT